MYNQKSRVSKEQHENHAGLLRRELQKDDNKYCGDCGSRSPTWASVNIGVFVCLTCSGIHRSLGVHISKVRSTTLDTWLPEEVACLQRMGNGRCRAIWEASLPASFVRPNGNDALALKKFIVDKYVHGHYRGPKVDIHGGNTHQGPALSDVVGVTNGGRDGGSNDVKDARRRMNTVHRGAAEEMHRPMVQDLLCLEEEGDTVIGEGVQGCHMKKSNGIGGADGMMNGLVSFQEEIVRNRAINDVSDLNVASQNVAGQYGNDMLNFGHDWDDVEWISCATRNNSNDANQHAKSKNEHLENEYLENEYLEKNTLQVSLEAHAVSSSVNDDRGKVLNVDMPSSSSLQGGNDDEGKIAKSKFRKARLSNEEILAMFDAQ